MNCQSLFSVKNKKKYFKMLSSEILLSMQSTVRCLNFGVNTVSSGVVNYE